LKRKRYDALVGKGEGTTLAKRVMGALRDIALREKGPVHAGGIPLGLGGVQAGGS